MLKKTLTKIFHSILISFVILIFSIIFFSFYILSPFPKQDDYLKEKIPSTYVINEPNTIERQGYNECSAFTSAYIMRHFGHEAKGGELYKDFKYKIPGLGYVLPKGIIYYFKKNTPYDIKLYTGDLGTITSRLLLGNPVIVLFGDSFNWQHYVVLMGYSENKFFLFDSARDGDTNGKEPGNRTLTKAEFLKRWNNGLPIFKRLYFVVE